MAIQYEGLCPCGYQDLLTVGGTRSTFEFDDPHPVYCTNCDDITSINMAATDQRCAKCGGSHFRKYGKATRDPRDNAADDNLGVEPHFCPKCKNYSMRFLISRFLD